MVGGSLGASASLVQGVRDALDRFAQREAAAAVDVRSGQLGDRAELVGAVAWAIALAEQASLHA